MDTQSPLYLVVGKSGSGKTTITSLIEQRYGYKSIRSYTTRPPRYENEDGHTFISKEEFDSLREDIVAYTEYNGFEYGTTNDQLNSVSQYVVDINGVKTLLENYTNKTRPIVVLYFDSTVRTRIDRMIDRGDSDLSIIQRLHNDEQYDWCQALDKIVWHYANLENRDVKLFKINANLEPEDVVAEVMYDINNSRCGC